MGEQQKSNQTEQDLNHVLKARRDKLAELQAAGKDPFQITKYDVTAHSMDIKEHYEAWEGKEASIAGRLMFKRVMGKASFCNIQDLKGNIQVYVARDSIGEDAYKDFKKMDIGDIVGVKGKAFTTKTGEISVHADEVTLLSKSLQVLPEKFHGLTDTDMRYRQRYVDLIMNAEVKDTFIKRSRILAAIRKYLGGEGFMEVETPMMQAVAGGAAARPFETYHNALDLKLYMRIAPELYLKRLLVGGFEKVFELNRNFRNEGIDTRHNPEFTSCEFYWAYANFHDLMDLTEELFARLANKVCGGTVITYQGQEIDLTPGKWTRMSFYESLTKIGGHSPEFYNDYNKVRDYIRSRGEKATDSESLPKLHAKLFDLDVEEKLIQPHFIYHYPTEISPLSRRNNEHPDLTDRFELFITGRELANAFSELNDPVDQRLRFEEQVREKEAGDDEAHAMDEDFLRALEYGMPPAAGEGIGIDRLVMLLTDSASIREVILFPLLRPEF